MRKLLTAIATLLLVTAGAASAQDPIFPPLVAGEYAFRIQTHAVVLDVNGVPLRAGAHSVAVFDVADPGTTIKCFDCSPGDVIASNVVVPSAGDRVELRARAYEAAGCIGLAGNDSPNGAYVYFTGPEAPDLVE